MATEKSPCETILGMDEGLGCNHHTQEWNSETVQDVTTVKGYHQDKKENNTNTEPLEELAEGTIADEAPDKQVDRQWNKQWKESWWKDTKITVEGENIWKIISEPRHKFSLAKCNMLKVIKTPKENHRRATAQEHPEKYSKEEINWNDTHHSLLIWQIVTLRINTQILTTVIIIKDPARGHNSIAMDRNHIKAIVLLPYEAIIKASEIAVFTEEQTLSLSNDSEKANTDKDTHPALSPHKELCRQPIEGQVVPSGYQWTNRQFRNSNQLMEFVFAILTDPRNDKGIDWLLQIWRQIDKTLFMVLGKTPCKLQEKGASYAHQTMEKNLLPEMRGQTEAPQMTKLYAQKIMRNKRKLHISRAQRTLYIKGWKEWPGRMCLSTSHPFTKPHSKEAGPLQNTEESGPMMYELNQTKKQETHDVVYATLLAIYETSLLPSTEVEEYGVGFTEPPLDLIGNELKQELKEVPLWQQHYDKPQKQVLQEENSQTNDFAGVLLTASALKMITYEELNSKACIKASWFGRETSNIIYIYMHGISSSHHQRHPVGHNSVCAPGLPANIPPVELTGVTLFPRQPCPATAVVSMALHGQNLWPPPAIAPGLLAASAWGADSPLEPDQSLPKTPEEALLADASGMSLFDLEGSQCQSTVLEAPTKNPLADEGMFPIVVCLPHHTLTSYEHSFAHLPLLHTCHSTPRPQNIILQAPCDVSIPWAMELTICSQDTHRGLMEYQP